MSQVGTPKLLPVTIAGGKTFQFRVPTLHDEIRISAKASEIRRRIDPDWDGFSTLDGNGLYALRAAATFECLLDSTSESWALDRTPTGVKVDSSKFPPETVTDVMQAYQGFVEALNSFRAGGSPDNGSSKP